MIKRMIFPLSSDLRNVIAKARSLSVVTTRNHFSRSSRAIVRVTAFEVESTMLPHQALFFFYSTQPKGHTDFNCTEMFALKFDPVHAF